MGSNQHFGIYAIITCMSILAITCTYTVEIDRREIWREPGQTVKHMRGICHFHVMKKQRIGAWKMNITLDRPTTAIEAWVMRVVQVMDSGKFYRMRSKYEYYPRDVDVEFILDFYGVAPKGVCSSNIEDPNPSTTTLPTTTLPTSVSLLRQGCPRAEDPFRVSTIELESAWRRGAVYTMTALCNFKFPKDLKKYCIKVDLDKNTKDFYTWFTTLKSSDENGQTYVTRNRFDGPSPWLAYAPGIQYKFRVKYTGSTLPQGNCTLYTWN